MNIFVPIAVVVVGVLCLIFAFLRSRRERQKKRDDIIMNNIDLFAKSWVRVNSLDIAKKILDVEDMPAGATATYNASSKPSTCMSEASDKLTFSVGPTHGGWDRNIIKASVDFVINEDPKSPGGYVSVRDDGKVSISSIAGHTIIKALKDSEKSKGVALWDYKDFIDVYAEDDEDLKKLKEAYKGPGQKLSGRLTSDNKIEILSGELPIGTICAARVYHMLSLSAATKISFRRARYRPNGFHVLVKGYVSPDGLANNALRIELDEIRDALLAPPRFACKRWDAPILVTGLQWLKSVAARTPNGSKLTFDYVKGSFLFKGIPIATISLSSPLHMIAFINKHRMTCSSFDFKFIQDVKGEPRIVLNARNALDTEISET